MNNIVEEFKQHVHGFAQSDILTEKELLANFALGLACESGEAGDLLKKYLFHGDDLNQDKFIKEMGDVIWYWFALLDKLGITPEEVMQANIKKLRDRHGGTSFDREAQRISKQKEA